MKRLGGMTVWVAAIGLALGAGVQARGQVSPASSGVAQSAGDAASSPNAAPTPAAASRLGQDDPPRDPLRRSEDQLNDVRNGERQKKLIADTEKLVELVNQLKTEVDKSTKDTMSVDVIKRADAIEKLAHSVKERMKGSE